MLRIGRNVLLLFLRLVPVAAFAEDQPTNKTVRLLSIGNSFSENATKFLNRINNGDDGSTGSSMCQLDRISSRFLVSYCKNGICRQR